MPLQAADLTNVLDGISSSDSVYYTIGGGILVVMAGIWGFDKVQSLLMDHNVGGRWDRFKAENDIDDDD